MADPETELERAKERLDDAVSRIGQLRRDMNDAAWELAKAKIELRKLLERE